MRRERRLASIRDRCQEGAPSITDEQKDEIMRVASTDPRSVVGDELHDVEPLLAQGVSGEEPCSGKDLSLLAEERSDKKGVRCLKSKKWKLSEDPDYDKKVKRILELYNNPPEDGVVVCIDEKGSTTVKDYNGSAWRSDAPRISDRQKIRGKAGLTAAYLPHSARVFYRFSSKKRAYHVTGLLRQVRASIPRPMKLYVILDNHHMHTGELMRGLVARDGFVELVYTPKSASWWNAIEQVFADTQKKVLNNSSFDDVGEIEGRCEEKGCATLLRGWRSSSSPSGESSPSHCASGTRCRRRRLRL
jgi:hypothetical protein